MERQFWTQPDEWACTKFCRINLDEDSVEKFILWLCGRARPEDGATRRFDRVELTWGWDAPGHRMAKLLWQELRRNTSEEEFFNCFSFNRPLLWMEGCTGLLVPIQNRLRWVLEGLFSRQSEDRELGQGDYGEHWWLPPEQAKFVEAQLQQTRADLIEHRSDYEYAIRLELCFIVKEVVKAIAVPCIDPARVYVGTWNDASNRVWVQSENGDKYPLKQGNEAYLTADGRGFAWGYGGHGPVALAHCILLDALDGNLELATRLEIEFFEKFTLRHSKYKDFRLSRTTVMRWLAKRGCQAEWEAQRQAVADRVAGHAAEIQEKEDLLIRIRKMGGLRTQRFDLVPATFESALYLDLMHMLEHSDFVLRCSRCGLPIGYDNSGRANRQRARAKKGQPIYHPECFAENSRTRKKIYWQERSRSPEFREQERQRALDYRKFCSQSGSQPGRGGVGQSLAGASPRRCGPIARQQTSAS